MHELTLAAQVLDIVEQALGDDSTAHVHTLRLSVPALAGVEVGALRFALDALAPGTALEGARIVIDEPASRARCSACAAEVPLRDRLAPCPVCGSGPLRVTGGTAMQVQELWVADAPATQPSPFEAEASDRSAALLEPSTAPCTGQPSIEGVRPCA
jgi:hydrogenase nickel incorporation protein HypA/HybF